MADSIIIPNHEDHIAPVIMEYEIQEYIKRHMYGQEQAIKKMSFIMSSYTKLMNAVQLGVPAMKLPRFNVIITGHTGGGKTFLSKKTSEGAGYAYHKLDCSAITAEGWVGTSLSEGIDEFLEKTPARSGIGILHLDEFDKVAAPKESRHTEANSQLQMNMLDLLDGDYQHVLVTRSKNVDLSAVNNALIVMSGSFQTLRDEENSKDGPLIHGRSIGFTANMEKKDNTGKGWKERLKDIGFLHELAGRIITQIEMEPNTKDDVKNIITQTESSAYKRYRNLFGTQFELSDLEIESIVDEVMTRDNGMRDIESVMFDMYYNKRGV